MAAHPTASEALGQRLAAFLRQRYARDRAKTLARLFAVSVPTAQRWLDGTRPTIEHFMRMYAVWGEELLRAAFPESFLHVDTEMRKLRTLLLGARVKGESLSDSER